MIHSRQTCMLLWVVIAVFVFIIVPGPGPAWWRRSGGRSLLAMSSGSDCPLTVLPAPAWTWAQRHSWPGSGLSLMTREPGHTGHTSTTWPLWSCVSHIPHTVQQSQLLCANLLIPRILNSRSAGYDSDRVKEYFRLQISGVQSILTLVAAWLSMALRSVSKKHWRDFIRFRPTW